MALYQDSIDVLPEEESEVLAARVLLDRCAAGLHRHLRRPTASTFESDQVVGQSGKLFLGAVRSSSS